VVLNAKLSLGVMFGLEVAAAAADAFRPAMLLNAF